VTGPSWIDLGRLAVDGPYDAFVPAADEPSPPNLQTARPQHHRAPANQVRHDDLALGARVADRVTAVFGSWGFIVTQSVLIILWLSYNGYAGLHYLHSREFDPYPFILLNLLFSTQAAYAAPLILLSQNPELLTWCDRPCRVRGGL